MSVCFDELGKYIASGTFDGRIVIGECDGDCSVLHSLHPHSATMRDLMFIHCPSAEEHSPFYLVDCWMVLLVSGICQQVD
jgi:hypothetical protein